jgi:hypothetical protein
MSYRQELHIALSLSEETMDAAIARQIPIQAIVAAVCDQIGGLIDQLSGLEPDQAGFVTGTGMITNEDIAVPYRLVLVELSDETFDDHKDLYAERIELGLLQPKLAKIMGGTGAE